MAAVRLPTDKIVLTDRYLRSLQPAPPGTRKSIWDAIIPGGAIRITDKSRPDNIGSFVLVKRFPGSSNPVPRKIGDYPAMSLAEYRRIARQWLLDLAEGIDPAEKAALREAEAAKQRADTFERVFEQFAEHHLSRLRSGKAVKAAIKNHVYPTWKDRPITSLGPADWNTLKRQLQVKIPVGVNRVYAYLTKFGNWAVEECILTTNPFSGMKRPAKETRRERVLSDLEIRAVWAAAATEGVFGRAVQLLLVTGQRRSEVAGMTWGELDLADRVWRLGRARTKAARDHEVPLSDLAVRIIGPKPLKQGKENLDLRLVLASGRSDNPISGWGRVKARIDEKAAKEYRALRGDPDAKLPEWHLHDLRRTAATGMARLGADRLVISKILNHAEAGVTWIYDRHRYDKEKRAALDAWATHIELLTAPKAKAGVAA